MKQYKIFALLFFVLVGGSTIKAQQDPMYSMYMFGKLFINPAYAGTARSANFSLYGRKQWAKFEGSPTSGYAAFHAPLRKINSGVGIIVGQDNLGITNRSTVQASYAYHIPVGNAAILSLGVSGTMSFYNSDFTELTYWDAGDPIYSQGRSSTNLPNVGTGIYFRSTRFFAGISMPKIISYNPETNVSVNRGGLYDQERHYFALAGYAIPLSPDFVLRPSAMVRFVDDAPVSFDLNLNTLIKNTIWLGASYRHDDSFVGLIQWQASPTIRMGYAHDFTTSRLRSYHSGTHEVNLSFDILGQRKIKYKTPRYF